MFRCRHFNGYKPCEKSPVCNSECASLEIASQSIIIVHLGAMGAVLRSTALLRMLKRKHPNSYITWVTEEACKPLLQNNPLVDRILGMSHRDLLILSGMKFDLGYFIDKSAEMAGLQKLVSPSQIFGFTTYPSTGAIIPYNSEANPLWEIGLDNNKKFFENTKPELQLVAEALRLPYERDEYLVSLSEFENELALARAKQWSMGHQKTLVGLNTGTSGILPNKTIPVDVWRRFLESYRDQSRIRFVLLGGSTDLERNERIAVGFDVVQSPTTLGLRDGLSSMMAVDYVLTGDSLGLHMAIALKKVVLAWFGPTCAHEIDLYGRGIKIKTSHGCSPCWKRSCKELEPCNQMIDVVQIKNSLDHLLKLNSADYVHQTMFTSLC
jgi:heptosyltransferase-2